MGRGRVYPRACGGTGLSIPRVYPRACGGTHPSRVYPRACGGTALKLWSIPAPAGERPLVGWYLRAGLSPRLRGNPAGGTGLSPRLNPVYPRACGGTTCRLHCYWVYPRACGGTAFALGLSPRLRGNLRAISSGEPTDGSIPAPAGEPLTQNEEDGPRVYPRACGGTVWIPQLRRRSIPAPAGHRLRVGQLAGLSPRSIPAPPTGLSPRLRGPASNGLSPRGEPMRSLRFGIMFRVYSRACGGTEDMGGSQMALEGLSPRLRGNPFVIRSIPAPAGEPPCSLRSWGLSPRLRGNRSGSPMRSCSSGLSPRLRGNPVQDPTDVGAERSIPAPAGEPCPMSTCSVCGRVYPRACGGTRYLFLVPTLVGRSIPAPAGEPSNATTPVKRGAVYPRACGGTHR